MGLRSLHSAPGQKKGPGDGDQPGPNNRADQSQGRPEDAVLKITFAELLRSCSRNIVPTLWRSSPTVIRPNTGGFYD